MASELSVYLAVTFLVAIPILIFVVLSPVVLSWISSDGVLPGIQGSDWQRLGNVGQAYGAVSAILAGLAFFAVSASLFLQARQTRVAQLQALLSMQLELLRTAYEHPDLQDGWSRSVDLPYPEWRKRTYMNLVFSYLQMGYDMRVMSTRSLRRTLPNRFKPNSAEITGRVREKHGKPTLTVGVSVASISMRKLHT